MKKESLKLFFYKDSQLFKKVVIKEDFSLMLGSSSNCDLIISNKRISVSSDFFNTYVLDIEKRRYFNSVTYYHEGDLEMIEFGETATGLFLTCFHCDSLNNKYIFHGESN